MSCDADQQVHAFSFNTLMGLEKKGNLSKIYIGVHIIILLLFLLISHLTMIHHRTNAPQTSPTEKYFLRASLSTVV